MDQEDLRYSIEHLWVRLDADNRVTIGVAEPALEDQGDLSAADLPGEGEEIIKEEAFGRLRFSGSRPIVLYAPVSGEITEVNEEVLESPEVIVEDPYQDGWLIRVEISNLTEYDELMTLEEYERFLEEELEEEEEADEDEEEDEDEF